MKSVVVSDKAESDLADIADYISLDNPRRALSFTEELEARFVDIGERPMSFPARPDWGVNKRSAVHGRYVIIFLVNDEDIKILRVVHGARDIDEMFS
jgi:toxin ParE1/3/4